jgi:hypothetical protein
MANSSFYNDGFIAGKNGEVCAPPDILVYALDYLSGFNDGEKVLLAIIEREKPLDNMQPGGANDSHFDRNYC